MKLFFLMMIIVPLFANAGGRISGNLTKKQKEAFKEVRIESGGLLMIDQYLKKSKENSNTPYTVKFFCHKRKPGNKTVCRVQEFHLLKRIEIKKI